MSTKITIRSLALLAVLGGAGVATQGCVIESSTPVICEPLMTVPWQIVRNVQGDPPITCATAGANIVGLDVNGQPQQDQVCAPGASSCSFLVFLDGTGAYTLDGFLVSGDTIISEVNPDTFSVNSCADFTTPLMVFPVNL